jgi:hypothetical protein
MRLLTCKATFALCTMHLILNDTHVEDDGCDKV